MGAALDENMIEPVAAEEEEGYASDSEAFSSVYYVLDSVRMAPSLVDPNDKSQYDYLLYVLSPSDRLGAEDEAMLTTLLKALTRAVTKIDAMYHASLLSNVFRMHLWFFGVDARTALLELIITLAAVPDKYLEGCLHMLVTNFVPPDKVLKWLHEPKWVIRKREIHQELQTALQYIFQYVPLAAFKLRDALDKTMPRLLDQKAKMNAYVECMLGLQREEIGDVLSATLFSKVINLLADLDVNITWDDILQEDQTIGIFDMELEDLDDHCFQFLEDSAQVGAGSNYGGFRSNNSSAFVEKLDSLMVVVCEHLNSRVKSGHLLMEYNILMDIFRTSVLKLHKSKFTQFVMFYACSLDPEIWGLKFAVDLAEIFLSTSEDPISRMSAISYLGSYLSRAKFISSSIIASILTRLVNWCLAYCTNVQYKIFDPRAHQIFYSACQAVMYILCFRMRELMDVPTKGALIKVPVKSFLFDLPLGSILFNKLDPLKVCLPSIVQEFLRQAKAAHLFHASVPSIYENTIDSELSKVFGGTQRLDIFFPFDPYLLKESDRFVRPNFVYWSMVKTTYSNCNSEEDEEIEDLEELDAPRVHSKHHAIGSFEDNYNVDYNNSDEEGDVIEFSLDKMSITPKQTSNLYMPAKIRPSVSPPL